ncbi:hypothetical protein CDD81_5306 [Ophiocordyceps australis]|uniref:Haloacid dehalogenase, type II n=1 Tax=Ophiocordyceps australis TaxID=1399860 RepID=A0A2C5YIZ6_9HYPO|nr:hypothetical protein CDD81_5306 [Ophiocordyceps australis]
MSPLAAHPMSRVKALAFDVFGTVVDWRTSVVEELELRAHRKALACDTPAATRERLTSCDWARFAQQWRDAYGVFTRSFERGRDAWKSVDEHHRQSLANMLAEWGFHDVYSDAELDSLALVWHRLAPWPDAVDGLAALRGSPSTPRYTLATLSNANISLLHDLNDYGSLGFQHLLSAEMFGAYKPDESTYRGAAQRLGLDTAEVAMVAAHLSDLHAARSCGLPTVYVERRGEEAWAKHDERWEHAREWVDVWISEEENGFLALSTRLQHLA